MFRFNRYNIFLIIIFSLILLGLIILFWIGKLNHTDLRIDKQINDIYSKSSENSNNARIRFFWGTSGNQWVTEDREINFVSERIEDKIAQVIEELINGSEHFHYNPIPEGTQLMSIFLDKRGVVYIDLTEAFVNNHPGGTSGEIMTIYSLVNTITENFSTIKGVKILVMGKEIETLKGHIDARNPFTFRAQP